MLDGHLISKYVEEYIAYKRSLGYKIAIEAEELRRFAAYARNIGHNGPLTTGLALDWASLNSEYSTFYKARRLETVHTFAKYMSAFDPESQVPQLGVFGKCHVRTEPYIFTSNEVTSLIAEAKKLFSPDGIRAYTVATAIALLRATGLRTSELTMLKNEDVRLEKGYLYIDSTKFKKSRIVPLHLSATTELLKYRDFIKDKLGDRSKSDYFFVSSYGQRFSTRSFQNAFKLIRPVLKACASHKKDSLRIRLYDLRHTFACDTIKRWLEAGEDVNQKLYLLSTYMGHTKPTDTYWYLSATPELLVISCNRYEETFDVLLTNDNDAEVAV